MDLSGAHVQMVHRECANGELLNASLQYSQTPDRHCTHRDRSDRDCAKSECSDRRCTHRSAALIDYACSILCLHRRSLSFFRSCASPRLSLTQDGSGESFVHSMCCPYSQRCGNKLRVLVCIDIEHLAPTHANNVNTVVIIG